MVMERSKASRKKGIMLPVIAIILLVAAGLTAVALINSRGNKAETIRGSLDGRLTKAPDLEINGALYPYKQDLVNILVMGIDKADERDRTVSFRSKGQADFLLLVTIDEEEQTVDFLQIDRDTMAEITVLTVLGQEAGTRPAQICLAHGFGGTRERSSQLTVQAVEKMLFGIQIDRFVSINMYDMGAIADSLGGIPVMISEEMEAIDPSFKKGEEILLLLSPKLFTNMSKGYMINVLNQTRDYKMGSIAAFDGIHRVGSNGFMEFHPDQTALQNHVKAGFTAGN